MKRILFLCPGALTIGGIQRYSRSMIVALDRYTADTGGHLFVLCLNDPPPKTLPVELSGLGASTICFFSGQRARFVHSFAGHVRDATVVIYGLLGFSPLVAIQKLLNPGSRSLLMLYGRDAWDRRSQLHAWGAHQMTSLVSISRYTLNRFRHVYSVPASKQAFVIPNPVDPKMMDLAQEHASSWEPGPLRLLSVARLAAGANYKGIDSVLQALPPLLQCFPDLVYTVIGDGSDRQRLRALARQLKVDTSVQFCGFVSEETLRREFARCTLYVMPSLKEGFGFVFIEAMAYGKPVVAARAGATPEVVAHGKTGLLVDFGDVPQLVEAISLLLSDWQLRVTMGQAGAEAVRTQYTLDAFQSRWSQLLAAMHG